MRPDAVPVTLLTGFLGSGKTTLVNRLLREMHGRRFAVIENEYGEVSVDADLLVREGGETVVQLTNGCVCCTVRGDLANALDDLARRRAAGEIAFDHVLIEPTGLADPGPIVRTFLAETEVLSKFYLDGVVALFDAVNGERNLAESIEAQAQVGYADRVLVTKVDCLDESAVPGLLQRLSAAMTGAEVAGVDLVRAPWGELFEKLLDLRGYQFDRVVFAPQAAAGGTHSTGISSVLFEADQALDGQRLNVALARIQQRYGESLWRMKGVLAIEGMRNRIVVQGVRGLVQANPSTLWRTFEPRRSRLVLIGRDLDAAWLRACLEASRSDRPVR